MKQSLFFILSLSASSLFAQSWNTTGNSGTNSSNNFVGTTDNQPLILKSNNNAGFRLLPAGNARIGLNDIDVTSPADLRVYNSESTLVEIANSLGRFQIAKAGCDGCYGEKAGDTVLRNLGKTHNIILSLPNNNNDGTSYIGINDGTRGTWVKFFNNGIARYDGKIVAKEVEVKANVWADYVFEKDYKLNSLEEVEKHIQENGHLPNIPSAEKVLQDGINVAEMNAKLLEKIEELTLYSIEQNKKLKIQSEKVEKMEKQLEKFLSEKK
ncbi:cell wall anchor protein [Chryseobacterium lathyri]|uniref:cell wall anchor protein n=1 Tax=Chryseobacterium lathyri TaxID=395933 RepID=UPI00277F5E8B|nr:cell wall anchor protein [Chryseobacterium lathyri]MDQ0066408.1 hypothetical protein [Chryseobacterium lathyri]